MSVDWALRVDALTAVMLVVITSVSALVHLYSWGYMSEDPDQPRFFSYLSLFTFAMLMLVTADNLVQMFFGWEGVGLASYLLIGFWFKKPSANAAAIKAFVVNRVGDLGFMLGIFGTYLVFDTVSIDAILRAAPGTTLAQRLVRAKRKIAEAGVPFEVPGPAHWIERLEAVLTTIEIAYSRAHEDAAGTGVHAGFAPEMLTLTAVLAVTNSRFR